MQPWARAPSERPGPRRWRTRDELHDAVVFWIERTYNRRRRQRALGKLTPIECELAFTTNTAADLAA